MNTVTYFLYVNLGKTDKTYYGITWSPLVPLNASTRSRNAATLPAENQLKMDYLIDMFGSDFTSRVEMSPRYINDPTFLCVGKIQQAPGQSSEIILSDFRKSLRFFVKFTVTYSYYDENDELVTQTMLVTRGQVPQLPDYHTLPPHDGVSCTGWQPEPQAIYCDEEYMAEYSSAY